MIVFTIYKNGGNAGAFGASFGCALFGVRGGSGVNAGAIYSTGAASSDLMVEKRLRQLVFGLRFCGAHYVARYLMRTPERARGRTR